MIIDQIVDVSISRQTTQIDITSFDIPLLLVDMSLVDEDNFTDRVREYTSIDSVGADFNSTHNAYTMAANLFGGDIKPSRIKIGKKTSMESYAEALMEVMKVDDTWYALMADSHEDSDINALATIIQAQRKLYFTSTGNAKALQQTQSVTYTATVDFGDIALAEEYDYLSVKIAGEEYRAESDDEGNFGAWAYHGNGAGTFVGNFTLNGSVVTITDSDAFVVTHAKKLIDEEKSDIDKENISVTDPVGMDIGQRLKFKSMFRTIIIYSATADAEFPECSWVGPQLVEVPGSNTWEYKRLVGTTVSLLTDSEVSLLESRNYNYYIPVKGVNIIRRGVSADKEWVDVLVLVDWLHARMQEQIFFRLINTRKIPYTNQGFALIENEIRSVLSQATANGGIDGYTVTAPDVLSIPEMQRAAREAGDFLFEARLAGAVSTVVVRGTVHS